jgi:hypothetical protein
MDKARRLAMTLTSTCAVSVGLEMVRLPWRFGGTSLIPAERGPHRPDGLALVVVIRLWRGGLP